MAAYQPPLKRHALLLALLGGACIIGFFFALTAGSVSLGLGDVFSAFFGEETMESQVVTELRLPRAVAALAAGGLLALAGALMQVLLRNPLADPYVLGVSGGASFAALLCLIAGIGSLGLMLGSFLGALLSMFLVFGLAHSRGSWTPTRLLLTGVIIAFGWGAAISFTLAVAPDENLRGMLFWLMGDLRYAQHAGIALLLLLAGFAGAWSLARDLNVLLHGELRAASLGVPVKRVRYSVYFLASLLTGAAVSLAGPVAFVGLVVPHMVRIVTGSDHRVLLPASVLLGALLVLLADTGARTLLAPAQLPVGVVTALIGVPVFLFLLQRAQRL